MLSNSKCSENDLSLIKFILIRYYFTLECDMCNFNRSFLNANDFELHSNLVLF